MRQKLYSVKDLSKILNLHQKTILRFIHEGKIKARKIGRTWMVNEKELKDYVHGELANGESDQVLKYHTIQDRIQVSAVIEIIEQNSEEASRISNSIMAMISSMGESYGKKRFDFFYYPEISKAKYLVHGSPRFISMLMSTFDVISQQKEN